MGMSHLKVVLSKVMKREKCLEYDKQKLKSNKKIDNMGYYKY